VKGFLPGPDPDAQRFFFRAEIVDSMQR